VQRAGVKGAMFIDPLTPEGRVNGSKRVRSVDEFPLWGSVLVGRQETRLACKTCSISVVEATAKPGVSNCRREDLLTKNSACVCVHVHVLLYFRTDVTNTFQRFRTSAKSVIFVCGWLNG